MTKQDMEALREIVIAAVVGGMNAVDGTTAVKRAAIEQIFPGIPDDVIFEAECAIAEAAEQPFWNEMAARFSEELGLIKRLRELNAKMDDMAREAASSRFGFRGGRLNADLPF